MAIRKKQLSREEIHALRGASPAMAEQKVREMAAMPVEIVPADHHQTHQAAIYKATCKMSYAGCFGAALARIRNAEFVTGDPEFKSVGKKIKIIRLTA